VAWWGIIDGYYKFKPNGKIQYFHKQHYVKYKRSNTPVIINDETDKTLLGFVILDGKIGITYKDITASPSTYRYFHPTAEEINQIKSLIEARTHEN
jgi:hypothetical protein